MDNEDIKNTCCIIGHRKIEDFVSVSIATWDGMVDLIKNRNVTTFKFGFYGEFNDLCYNFLSTLKARGKNIKLVLYSLNNEVAFTFEEAEKYKNKYKKQNKKFPYKCFDEIVYLDDIDETKFKSACVLRNLKLIDESEYCMIYYRKNYILPSNRNSGTKIAYEYACKRKKKMIIP